MKKIIVGIFACVLLAFTLVLSACGGDKSGTYYPSNEEMKANLEKNGYSVEVYDNLHDYEWFFAISTYYDGTLIKATKGDDYIYFSRLNNANQCDALYNIMENRCENYNSLVKIINDEKFGSIVYCGTDNAINDAGIKVVKVDVDVKV